MSAYLNTDFSVCIKMPLLSMLPFSIFFWKLETNFQTHIIMSQTQLTYAEDKSPMSVVSIPAVRCRFIYIHSTHMYSIFQIYLYSHIIKVPCTIYLSFFD